MVCRERPHSRYPRATWETGMWLTRACAGDRDPTKPFRAFQSSLSFARTFMAVVGINGAIVGIIIPNNPTQGSLWSHTWNCSPQHCPSALAPCFPAGMPGRIPPSLVSHPPCIPHHQGKGGGSKGCPDPAGPPSTALGQGEGTQLHRDKEILGFIWEKEPF